MAGVELTHEKTGRKVTVKSGSEGFYKGLGWVEANPKAKADTANADSDTGEGTAPARKAGRRGASAAG